MEATTDLRIGEEIDTAAARTGTAIDIEPGHLTTHGVIVGMTGSGKTGLGIVLLEEALSRGIPALIIDPKGDMGNLLLNFPALRAEDFHPWVDAAEANRNGESVDQLAEKTAARWRDGLAAWGIGAERMRSLGMSAAFTIFTPGSSAGVPVDVVGSLQAPAATTSPEARADEIEGFVSGLLALVGRDADPLSSADHILLSNLIARAWSAGTSLDLATLIGQVADPPIRKLGVFELDTFMPPKDRVALAVQLNALLASPSFEPWMRGVPLDMQRMLFDDAGRPRAAILSLAHLSDPERQFIVTLAMSRMVGWMRTQPGTSDLRALVYMDEVAGFAPPTAQPPSKKPILTILKQARAHGVGMVLSTQNPVDLDYKAMSNAGTWMIGRLQTERDKARILEGMRSAAGDVDIGTLDAMIGELGPRQFMLHTSRGGAPRRFTTRWAMSFLRGPLTRLEIERLMDGDPLRDIEPPAQSAAAPEDAVSIAPDTAAGITVRYLDPSAPWAAGIGADGSGAAPVRLEPALAARVHLRYDDTAADLDHAETYECVCFPLSGPARPEDAHVVDYDDRDFRDAPPAGATYALTDARIDEAAYFRAFEKQLKDHLYRTRTTEIFVNRELKLYSRPGEDREAFLARCTAAADERADAEAAKVAATLRTKLERLQKQQGAAEDRVRELDSDSKQRLQQEIIAGAGQLLSAFLGGRRSIRSLSGVASRRGTTMRTKERLETARGKAEDTAADIAELEAQLSDQLTEIEEKWNACAGVVEPLAIPLEQSDVRVEEVTLVWVPVAG